MVVPSVFAAADAVVDFLRSLPHGDVWICVGVGLAAFCVMRFVVRRIILILVVAAALAALAWWVMTARPDGTSPEKGISQQGSVMIE